MCAGLPSYEPWSNSDTLPGYDGPPNPLEALPPTFKIGKLYTTPLISVAQVKSHLLVLGAFCRLRRRVLDEPSPIDPFMREDVKWTLFLTRAALRFELWVHEVVSKDARRRGEMPLLLQEYEIPPLDVLLFWHAYLLSPVSYFHDCEAMYPQLRQIGPFPLTSIAHRINLSTFEYTPTINQLEEWELVTRQDFDPPISTSLDCHVTVACPRCSELKDVPLVVEITQASSSGEGADGASAGLTGSGYAQNGFTSECHFCGFRIDRGTLAANNVARDLERAANDADQGKRTFMNGNLLGARGKVAPDVANHFVQLLFRHLGLPAVGPSVNKRMAYGKYLNWDMERAQLLFEFAIQATTGPKAWHGDFLRKSFRAYRQPQPFSIDLVGSVMRQFKFSEQVHQLDWTSFQFLAAHPSLITEGIIQYHMFLDLNYQSYRMLVPTIGIDLVWHTHMLFGDKYHEDVLKYVDKFMDHDDRVEEGHLARAYEETSTIWKDRFNAPYTQTTANYPGSDQATTMPSTPANNAPPKTRSILRISRPSLGFPTLGRKAKLSSTSETSGSAGSNGAPSALTVDTSPANGQSSTSPHPPTYNAGDSTPDSATDESAVLPSCHNSVLVYNGGRDVMAARRSRVQGASVAKDARLRLPDSKRRRMVS
ncbi:hypothetical protein DL93DRAFT_2093994 [Clavulina sp. PMI_390]|nr:hypothetical protein DL93DRAFT_2093994 [Clavulina sp. PMI_390]